MRRPTPEYDLLTSQCEQCGILWTRATARVRERGSNPPRWRCRECFTAIARPTRAVAVRIRKFQRMPECECPACGRRSLYTDGSRAVCSRCHEEWTL